MSVAFCYLIGIISGAVTLWIFAQMTPKGETLGCGAFLTAFAVFFVMAIMTGNVIDSLAPSFPTSNRAATVPAVAEPTPSSTVPERAEMTKRPEMSKEEIERLRAIYESAPQRRASTDQRISGAVSPIRVNNDTESPRLESLLRNQGWNSPTVTNGVKIREASGYTFKLEVIDGNAQDWYVIIETDRSLSTGRVIQKSRGSPW